MKHAISWFEIPTTDIERAARFYEAVFQVSLVPMEMPNLKMRMFPIDDPMEGIGGALCQAEGFYHPSLSHGPLIYLNGNPDVQLYLDRIVGAGGKVLVPKTEISPEYGFMAVFEDSEGNRIALHSVPAGA
ncbi:VOC family protein [Flavihumibacter rivuli]|uniref:VOC family protein n=1 Tax=Flavihumibacter rivuli TaxID=2838156 RepID=UPI001BDF02ED|nr:VOC family protein [Flavihumibacter rivuli]ULQ55593.1 VOC family protein [Flavihumibacter rivuli]